MFIKGASFHLSFPRLCKTGWARQGPKRALGTSFLHQIIWPGPFRPLTLRQSAVTTESTYKSPAPQSHQAVLSKGGPSTLLIGLGRKPDLYWRFLTQKACDLWHFDLSKSPSRSHSVFHFRRFYSARDCKKLFIKGETIFTSWVKNTSKILDISEWQKNKKEKWCFKWP